MLPALQYMMRMRGDERYLRNIVVLTDGDLGNEEQIFEALRQELGSARVYKVAIGSAPNHFLATKMAQYGRGTFTHVADLGEVREQMLRLFESIESPVLTDLKLSFAGVEIADVYPQRAPDLFMRQPLVMYGRIVKGSAGRLHLTARAAGETYETSFAFDAVKASFHPGITTLWARQRVDELMDHWRRAEEEGRGEIRGSIVAHAIRYRLVTRFTSLVAVEEVVANAGGDNKTVTVPTELPAGMQMEKVFGAPATGTADEFFEALGFALLLAGMALFYLRRKAGVAA
jgi:Ca-activated chloride channel homolog